MMWCLHNFVCGMTSLFNKLSSVQTSVEGGQFNVEKRGFNRFIRFLLIFEKHDSDSELFQNA